MSIFSRKETKEFYDRFGKKQDKQAFYEDPALDDLIEHSHFEKAKSVVEFGCGTGRFAEILLTDHLSNETTYTGFDISTTMVDLARQRIQKFDERAEVMKIEGEPNLPLSNESADRFVSSFVLDILSKGEIDRVIAEAKRVLQNGGLICLITITYGIGFFSKIVMTLWNWVHRIQPALVGGCRPIELCGHLESSDWEQLHHGTVVAFGVSSDVIVACKR